MQLLYLIACLLVFYWLLTKGVERWRAEMSADHMLTKQIDDKSSVDISEITWNTDMTYLCIFFSRSTFFLCIRTCMQDSIRFSFSQSYTFSSLFFQITIIRVHILFTAQSTYDLISRLQMNSSHRSKLINNARGANKFQITSCYIIFT